MDLKALFHSVETEKLKEYFATDQQCLAYLAAEKEKSGFVCRFCGGSNCGKGRTPYSRRCTKCKREESATAGTIFHHCRMPLSQAFEIAWLVCGNPEMTGIGIARILETRHMTCLNFKKKIMQCIRGGTEFLKFADVMTDKGRI
jgi:hypothetical protein